MKTFTQLINGENVSGVNTVPKHCLTSDTNPGNHMFSGVSNHWTPIDNIVTNVKNLFGIHMGIVASVAEDGVSIKLHSSKFYSKENTMKILYETMYHTGSSNGLSLYTYITSQGLDQVKLVEYGNYWIVYFYASDLKQAEPVKDIVTCPVCNCNPCTCKDTNDSVDSTIPHPCENLQGEAEMTSINEDDEEIEDLNYKEICELINSNNKVKAAKALANVIASMVEVPDNMYIAAVKDSDGNESIALRQTLKQRRPFGKEEEVKKSLFNIYNTDKDGIWINDWDNKDTALSKDIQDVITAIMKAIRAKETNDPCVWQLCDGPNVKSIDTVDTIEDDDDDDINDDDDDDIDDDCDTCPNCGKKCDKCTCDDDDDDDEDDDVKESEDEIAYVIYDKDGDIVFVSPDKQEAQDKIKEYSKANKFAKFRIKEEPLSDYEK